MHFLNVLFTNWELVKFSTLNSEFHNSILTNLSFDKVRLNNLSFSVYRLR